MPQRSLHLLSPAGFRATGVYAGIKSKHAPDVGLLICETRAAAAAVFTTNKVVSPGVTVGRANISRGRLRGIVVNSGNANACTGRRGFKDAQRMCALAAKVGECAAREILPSSTGIIGHHLPMEKLERGIIEARQYLGNSLEHANLFADAILTTDTRRKTAAVEVKLGRERVVIAGVCKGSGMIGPRMATMLGYITTDAAIAPPLLKRLLKSASDKSFNCVTVDDHASTNDTVCILASGLAGVKIASAGDTKKFSAALDEVCQSLAYQIAADGEGATKVVKVVVRNCAAIKTARAIARTIANSPLVKCAMHGNDPNWGRIISAAGMADLPFDPNKCVLKLQGTSVFRASQPAPFNAKALSKSLAAPEVLVDLDCRSGKFEATVWTCDLSKEYVTINADYHT